MKRSIVTLSLITLFLANAFAQITNGGFEDWTNSFVFSDPDEWRTGNGQLAPFVQTTQITSGAPNGNSAVRMETLINGTDTLFGFVMMGNIEDDMATEGVPFTTNISEISAQLRYDIQPGDSALVLLNVWQGSVATEFQIRLGGSQATWMYWTYTLGTTLQSVDSVAFAAASSDPFNPVAVSGSWLELDNVMLTDPSISLIDLLPNNSFEDWTDVYVEDPDNWFTYNLPAQSLGVTPVIKSTDAFAGNFSAQLSNIMEGDGGIIPGVISNGMLGPGGFSNGVPYAAEPTQFTGQYKYTPVDMDTAYVSVTFFQNGNVVGIAAMAIIDPTTAWTAISLPISLTGIPDTMQFIAFAGQNGGSTLWLDELDLSGGNVGLDELEQNAFHVYPSPARDQLYIANTNAPLDYIRLFDTNGMLVQVDSNTPTTGTTVLDVSRLSSGVYIVEMKQAGTVTRRRFVKD